MVRRSLFMAHGRLSDGGAIPSMHQYIQNSRHRMLIKNTQISNNFSIRETRCRRQSATRPAMKKRPEVLNFEAFWMGAGWLTSLRP
jgi:hypothetical protein